MPIKINPSQSVDIDLARAVDGEVVAVTLENGNKLFLSVWTSSSGRKFLAFEPTLRPHDLSNHIDAVINEVSWTEKSLRARIEHGTPGESTVEFLERWLKGSPLIVRSHSIHGQRKVDMIDVGETPYVELPYPADHVSHQWEASAPISSIEIATKEAAISYMALTAAT